MPSGKNPFRWVWNVSLVSQICRTQRQQQHSLVFLPGAEPTVHEVAPGCVLGPLGFHNAPQSATELAESQEGRQHGSYLEHLKEINPLLKRNKLVHSI